MGGGGGGRCTSTLSSSNRKVTWPSALASWEGEEEGGDGDEP